MKLAIVGSRGLYVPDDVLEQHLPEGVTEIVSGGANGVDTCAAGFARRRGIPLRELRPDYDTYGDRAPLIRNIEIIRSADLIYIFWDGRSNGSAFVIKKSRELGKPYRVFARKGDMPDKN